MRGALRRIRHRAVKNGIPFDLTFENLPPVPKRCPWLDIPLMHGPKNYPNWPSLDRINPAKGYIEGNVHWISNKANWIKNCASLEELIKVTLGLQQLLNNQRDGNGETS